MSIENQNTKLVQNLLTEAKAKAIDVANMNWNEGEGFLEHQLAHHAEVYCLKFFGNHGEPAENPYWHSNLGRWHPDLLMLYISTFSADYQHQTDTLEAQANLENMKALIIQIRIYVITHSRQLHNASAWHYLVKMLGVSRSYKEDDDWLATYIHDNPDSDAAKSGPVHIDTLLSDKPR